MCSTRLFDISGANKNIKNNEGRLPYDLARNPDSARFLKSKSGTFIIYSKVLLFFNYSHLRVPKRGRKGVNVPFSSFYLKGPVQR